MIANKEEELVESMRSVIDPEIGLNVVELGLCATWKLTKKQTPPKSP
ncbi:MAG: hypothetical protein R3D55_00835 [Chloroflexota bacterium]